MRKSWLAALALSLGWIGSTTAFGQYPNAYNNFGPSSYPVQQQPPVGNMLQNLPQVPQQYQPNQPTAQYQPNGQYQPVGQYQPTAQSQPTPQFQLVAAQDQSAPVYGLPSHSSVDPVPAPTQAPQTMMAQPQPQYMQPAPAAAGCTSCQTQSAQQYQSPVDYGYQQSVAPNAVGYGSAPGGSQCSPGYGNGSGYFGGNAFAGNSQIFGGNLGGGAIGGGGLPSGAKPWFFGAGALIFNRIDNHSVPLSFSNSSYNGDLITSQSARMAVTGGFEASAGRYFNCGKNAIQASYWGLYPSEQSKTITGMPNDFKTRIPFTYMQMPGTPMAPGVPYDVAAWFNNGHAHQLTRSSNYHNVEVNLLGFAMGGASRNFNMSTAGTLFSGHGGAGRSSGSCGYCGGAGCGSCGTTSSKYATGPCGLSAPACGSRLNMSWLGGFRYFHFSDNLQYASSLDDAMINRSADDLYYNVDTTNNLFGFQLGSRADYCLGQRVNLYGTGKVGVYNNHSRLLTRLGTDGQAAYLNDTRTPANPGNFGDYNFDVSKDNVAFLSEIGTGVGLRLSPKWSGTVGYRAVIVSGVATSPDNIRSTFANYNDIVDYNTSSCLILHGLNVGALYNF